MKALRRIGIICFGLLSAGSFLVSLSIAGQLYLRSDGESAPPAYHFALYLPEHSAGRGERGAAPGNRNSFFDGIIRGARRAAAELNAAVSVHSIEPGRYELEMAAYTGADGAVVCPYLDDALARRQLDRLSSRQIPVVIIDHNVPNDQPWPFIGTNNFEVGRKIGAFAGSLGKEPVRMALVYSDKAPGIYGERELVEMGVAAALGEKLIGPIMGFKTNLNPLDAEQLLYRLFRTGPDINTVVFTDANDTIAAAQTLIDMNLVGRVRLIGFGADPLIADSVRKGIIAGSVLIDPERIGYEALRSLWSLWATGYTSTSIDTGAGILDRHTAGGGGG